MFRQNPDFSLSREKDKSEIFFSHKNGASVRTDELTATIWREASHRSVAQTYEAVGLELPVSRLMVETAISLMVSAGLLEEIESHQTGVISLTPIPNPAPLVSVIIVNYNGYRHLDDLFESLSNQTYQSIEIIMVDNASRDESIGYVRSNWPDVKVIAERRNLGFAAGNNAGINEANGEYYFLVNNDTKVDSECVAALVAMAGEYPEAAAIVPKIKFFSLPGFINAIGNSVRPHGWGSDNYIGYVDNGFFDRAREVFSACFGAVLISRVAIEKVGPLDGAYRFYYEDSDWSYRSHLLGFKIFFSPQAIVYHKFNATMNTLSYEFKLRLLVGNRIRFALKNLALRPALSFTRNYVKEDIRNFLGSLLRGEIRRLFTYVRAWLRLIWMMPGIYLLRRRIQKSRLPGTNDYELFDLLPEAAVLIDGDACPVLDSKVIRQVYIHESAAEVTT